MNTVAENARPGSTGWWDAPHAPPAAIEGYTTQPSVVAGDAISLCVSTRPAARYTARLYRLGWYGGAGGRLMASFPGNVGLPRDAPEPDTATGIVRAGWPVTDVLQTSEEWCTGQYAVVLELTSGPHAGTAARVPFVVRRLPGEAPPVLVQMPINTTQAYNHWGGKCLYYSNSTDNVAAVKVSFDRPVLAWEVANLNSRAPFVYDLPLIRWLEREGFDVAYQTNVDTHRNPASLTGPRLIVTAGHDEYWTREMRDAFDDAQARGVSLAFMGANTGYWQIRYEDDERTIVEYRSDTADPERDPTQQTMRFRDLKPPRPERELMGQQYEGGLIKPSEPRDFRFVPAFATDGWAAGLELEPDRPLTGLVGYEWDTFDQRQTPPGCVRMLHCDGPDLPADALHWTARSGARIFAAGSLQFAWGLDDWAAPGMADSRLQQVMRTGFREMLS